MNIAAAAILLLFAQLAAAETPDGERRLRCEPLLERTSTSLLRHFRSAEEFSETRNGTWMERGGRLIFVPIDGSASIRAPIENNASHLEIIRRQIGNERFNQIMSSPSSGDELARILAEIAIAAENPDNVREAEELLEDIEAYAPSQPLSEELERQVLTLYKKMERLASPMAEWLRPKVLEGRINQLPASSFDQRDIERRIGPNVRIFKASKVTILLAKPRTFIISSGKSSFPDNLHSVAQDVLNKLLPKSRFFNRRDAVPGYLIVYGNNGNFNQGRIEFVRKGDLVVEDLESFDFN